MFQTRRIHILCPIHLHYCSSRSLFWQLAQLLYTLKIANTVNTRIYNFRFITTEASLPFLLKLVCQVQIHLNPSNAFFLKKYTNVNNNAFLHLPYIYDPTRDKCILPFHCLVEDQRLGSFTFPCYLGNSTFEIASLLIIITQE